MRSLRTRTIAEEQMDAPDLPFETYLRVLTDLSRVNRITMNARPTLGYLRRALGKRRSFRLLDVGFGQGDMLRAIAHWARKRGIDADLAGVDLNPGSELVARAATTGDMPIRYITGDYRDLAGEGYDFIVSSLVTHHMSHSEMISFLQFMDFEATSGWLVSDLHRKHLPYLGFPLIAHAFGWHKIVREDGQLSIARSFRVGEWQSLLAEAGIDLEAARVVRRFPFDYA